MITVPTLYRVSYKYDGILETIITDNANECISKKIEQLGSDIIKQVEVEAIKCTKIIIYDA